MYVNISLIDVFSLCHFDNLSHPFYVHKGYAKEELKSMVETIKRSSAKVVVTFIISEDAKVK